MTVREDRYGNVVQASRPGLSQVVAVGAANVLSVPFQNVRGVTGNPRQDDGSVRTILTQTTHVRLVATVACWVSFGTSPVAVFRGTSSMFIPAGLPEYFWVVPGEQIGVIQDTGVGFLYITELAP